MSCVSKSGRGVLVVILIAVSSVFLPMSIKAADSVAVAVYDCNSGRLVPNGDTLSDNDGQGNPQQYELRIGIANDILWGGMSLGFQISSPDGVSWEWLSQPEPAYGTHKYVTVDTTSRMSPVSSIWDFGFFAMEYNVDGIAADSILLGGVANAGGLPPGEAQKMISIRFKLKDLALYITQTLEIDSCKVGDAGDWACIDSIGNYYSPKFSGKLHFTTNSYVCGTDDRKTPLPKTFSLHQNNPNPFNPVTRIVYDLPRQAPVKLEIFNIQGQKVAVLVDQVRAAGSYLVTWDGTDSNSRTVPSGIYFYRIRAGEDVSTRKMLLLK